ncbi:hypothetical protein MITSMUL_03087 [Mitsuokella multacida DSM 20544]|uniref:Uncharacterized protein n=1 Tax=Mitsuokella multacida DSM 20544 TaxID=500635 RepID=C9KJ90_9FIRM|nr:hypothetical protein MITSMUL_03087 [Mitsuokella multacida DSM 20544]
MRSQHINGFTNGRPTKSFFKLYNFFKKQPLEVLNLLHEFLETKPRKNMNMSQLFYEARNWNTGTKVAKITKTNETDYFALLKEM